MRIIFVRHAEPDYANDTLTEKGWREAALLAERVSGWDVTDFYVSPKKKPSAARWAVPLAIVLTLAIAAAVVFSLRKTCANCGETFFGKSHSLYGYDICDDCWTKDGYGDIIDYYDDVLDLFD